MTNAKKRVIFTKNTVKIYSKTVNFVTVNCLNIHNEKYALYVILL